MGQPGEGGVGGAGSVREGEALMGRQPGLGRSRFIQIAQARMQCLGEPDRPPQDPATQIRVANFGQQRRNQPRQRPHLDDERAPARRASHQRS